MTKYYWHNIGQPYRQSWWDRLRNLGLITTGFQNKAGGKGEKILRRYEKNDIVIAYANSYGALGVGRVTNPDSYRLVPKKSVSSGFESNHRHWLSIEWLYVIENLDDGVPFEVFGKKFGIYYPRQTSLEINFTGGAKALVRFVDRGSRQRWP